MTLARQVLFPEHPDQASYANESDCCENYCRKSVINYRMSVIDYLRHRIVMPVQVIIFHRNALCKSCSGNDSEEKDAYGKYCEQPLFHTLSFLPDLFKA